MSDIAELHTQAQDHTGRVVAGIEPGRWAAATPRTGQDLPQFPAMLGRRG
jgi:hypothetical protein